MRKVWLAVYYAIAYRLPGPPFPGGLLAHKLRRFLARRIFSSMGGNVTIGTRVDFGAGANISIGDGSNIGKGSWIANDTIMGRNVMTGPEIVILSYNHKTSDPDLPYNQQGYTDRSPVLIGDNVWIGTRAILLPGVRVGNGAVIGAGSVVTREVPSNAVAAGNPARIVNWKDR